MTRQVKEMEREALMEREVSQEAQVVDQEEQEGARPVQKEQGVFQVAYQEGEEETVRLELELDQEVQLVE